MSLSRRGALAGLAALAAAPAAGHTLYGQWVVYRRKHLLIGCHRADMRTSHAAQAVIDALAEALPEAKARMARARRADRLASLLVTDQLQLAVLTSAEARSMAAGDGPFAPYGPAPLTSLAMLDDLVLTARASFPARHAWLVAAALDHSLAPPAEPQASPPVHPGAAAYRDGAPEPA